MRTLDGGGSPSCHQPTGQDCSLQTTTSVVGLHCGPDEQRCFLMSDRPDGDQQLVFGSGGGVHRERDHQYLFGWADARVLVSLGLVVIVYERSAAAVTAGGGQFAVVPLDLLRFDTYPAPSKSSSSWADGFNAKARLRIVLRPGALRVIWWGVLASRAWRRTARSDRPSRRAPPTGRAPSRDWTRSREQILQKLDS